MIKKFILFAISTILIHASALDVKVELISTIVQVFVPKKDIVLYIEGVNYQNIKNLPYRIRLVSNKEDANVMFLNKPLHVNDFENKLIFYNSYRSYINAQNPLGALFWQKGRPNLIFNKKRLNELQINLPNNFMNYIE